MLSTPMKTQEGPLSKSQRGASFWFSFMMSSIDRYIDRCLVWFGWALYRINPCGLFNVKILFIYIQVNWPTAFEGDPKALFLLATTPRCTGGRYSFSWIVPFTLDPFFTMLSVKQGGIKNQFLSLSHIFFPDNILQRTKEHKTNLSQY